MAKEIILIPERFGDFKVHVPGPKTTMRYGFYYESERDLPFASDRRMIRVWLPESYGRDPERRYPVIYMSDGQNLVDEELTAYGDWHLDRVMHELKEKGLEAILVGIDCPKERNARTEELHPPFRPKARYRMRGLKNPHANLFLDYIRDELKPEIDSLFLTKPELEHTGIGGSSMGGIMAFYAFFAYRDVFGFSLAFSVPTFFYSKKRWKELLTLWGEVDPSSSRRLAMFVGGSGFEKRFLKGNLFLRKELIMRGMNDRTLHFDKDESRPHHEEAWSFFALPALEFLLRD